MANNEDFPDIIHRVILNAEVGHGLNIEVLSIPCKKTSKVYKTATKKAIKHSAIMCPDSYVRSDYLMEFVYCNKDDIPKAIDMLMNRAKSKSLRMMERAKLLNEKLKESPIINFKDFSKEDL